MGPRANWAQELGATSGINIRLKLSDKHVAPIMCNPLVLSSYRRHLI